ncbi:MAG: flagellin [Bdellovibrionales bacterium]
MGVISSITNLAVEFQTTRLMRTGRDTLLLLQAQMATGKKTQDLSTLGITNTRTLLSARATQSKLEGYIDSIKTVETRLQFQSSVLAGIDAVLLQAQNLVSDSATYDASVTNGAASLFQSFMQQIQIYLNQRVEDRGIFAGDRLSSDPVKNLLTTLPVPPTEAYPFTPDTSPTLPAYDTAVTTELDATSIAFDDGSGAGTGTLTLGSSTWEALGYQVGDTVTITGTTSNNAVYTITSLSDDVATVAELVTDEAADTSFTAIRSAAINGPAAYIEDSVYIDDGFLASYGITSTDPAFQNLIMGLRWAYVATQDQVNYTTYMDRAYELLGTSQTGLRQLQAEVVSNINVFSAKRETHETSIITAKNQEDDIIAADVNEAATRLSILSAQIEASYAATGRIINLTIVDFI